MALGFAMNLVIGARGRLGGALVSHLSGEETVALERSVYSAWTQPGAAENVTNVLKSFAAGPHTIFVAAGITDPKRPSEEHNQVNLNLPQNVIEGASRLGLRVITFGTIMEEVVGRTGENPYYDSKMRLSDYVRKSADDAADVLHIRIHTLYGGGPPERFMFLGQLLDAVRRRETFKMSAGDQLREYHHVDDDVTAISLLANSTIKGFVNLSHGVPVRLRELATYVCGRFDCLDRLQIGALPTSGNENYDRLFEPLSIPGGVKFRETLPAVFDYMKSCCTDVR
jgi:nucleoside-diphosphate-sugar epimerase